MTSYFKMAFFCLLISTTLAQASELSEMSHPDDDSEVAAIALQTFQRLNTDGLWRYPERQEDGTNEKHTVDSANWVVKFYEV